MLRGLALTMTLVFAFGLPASAAELGGDISKLAEPFNEKAKALHYDVRIELRDCTTNALPICLYLINGGDLLAARSGPDKVTVNQVGLFLVKMDPSNLRNYATALVNLVAMYIPDAKVSEITVLFSMLNAQIGVGQKTAEMEIHGIKVKIGVVPGIGIVSGIARAP
ncbi:hypothetical protein [Xanthobacter agilis]|uniref:hypothetical protein n=1 Tax=Xanthobacter agilis TaxID=47492 RepID=UPI00372BD45E